MALHQYTELENGIGRLTLTSGSGNPLTPELLTELHQSLSRLEKSPPRALIIDGGEGKIFSGGFALPIIGSWDRKQISDFFSSFLEVLHQVILLPCPTFTALNGHAIAGGFILSLATDFRIAPTRNLKLGLSEVHLGVLVPAGTRVLFEERTTKQAALKHSMFGELFDSNRGLEIGYAVAVDENPLKKAIQMATVLTQIPGYGATGTKLLRAQPLSKLVRQADDIGMQAFLYSWFSEDGQAGIKAMAIKLAKN